MNYQEEQNSELEALQSIYPAEFRLESADFPASFSVDVKCEDFDEENPDSVECCLMIKYTTTYPDTAPEIAVENCSENLLESDENQVENIERKLRETAESSLGIVMCFTLVSALQEELNSIRDAMKQERLDAAERIKRELDEAELRRTQGTHVTVETFLAWKQKFDAEMKALGRKRLVDMVDKSRPTGREQFTKDANLATSDIRLIEESGEEVKIDESLFTDFDLDDDVNLDEFEEDDT